MSSYRYNETHSHMLGYRFEVIIDGRVYGFKTVSGLTLISGFEPLEVGGMNAGPVMLRSTIKQSGKIVLERGKPFSDNSSTFTPGMILNEPMSVTVKDDFGNMGVEYSVRCPQLESIEISSLDAMSSAIIIERMSIVHEGITEKRLME